MRMYGVNDEPTFRSRPLARCLGLKALLHGAEHEKATIG